MDLALRKPYQGVFNIVRFNWHFYLVAGLSLVALLITSVFSGGWIFWICILVAAGIVLSTCISLLVSHHVYDRSDLYDFRWLQQLKKGSVRDIVNIHAGFDETSETLKINFSDANLKVFDFYDPVKHTEVSISRARKAYPAFPGTVRINTSRLPLGDRSADIVFNLFALHEVRDRHERIDLIKDQARVLRHDGKLVVVEHLRDLRNFLAYNIGFFHFLPAREWNSNFREAGLTIEKTFKITPFVTVFILRKS